MNLSIEFMPWYVPGDVLVRCGGNDGCGALVGDADQHRKWHEKMFPYDVPLPSLPVPLPRVQGVIGPPCTCGRARPCGGPHDCAML